MPDGVALLGEEALLAPLRARPPDWVVIARRDTSELGASIFGIDYAQATLAWLREIYEPDALIGADPLRPGAYGMLLLRRRVAPRG